MSNMTRRVTALEGRRDTSYDHLSDSELWDRLGQVIEQLGKVGVPLPSDWQDRLREMPEAFCRWMIDQAKGLL